MKKLFFLIIAGFSLFCFIGCDLSTMQDDSSVTQDEIFIHKTIYRKRSDGVVYSDSAGIPNASPSAQWWINTHKQLWFNVPANATSIQIFRYNNQKGSFERLSGWTHGFAHHHGFTIPAGYRVTYFLWIDSSWSWFHQNYRYHPDWFYVWYY
jgi:hypothetical protein